MDHPSLANRFLDYRSDGDVSRWEVSQGEWKLEKVLRPPVLGCIPCIPGLDDPFYMADDREIFDFDGIIACAVLDPIPIRQKDHFIDFHSWDRAGIFPGILGDHTGVLDLLYSSKTAHLCNSCPRYGSSRLLAVRIRVNSNVGQNQADIKIHQIDGWITDLGQI